MVASRPTTIAQYIAAAPRAGQPHLRRLYALLKGVAPKAEEAIKWGTPFFIEPRFLFAFAAHKAHLSFAPSQVVLTAFRKELEKYETTQMMLKVRYDAPLPEVLIRKLATRSVRELRKRKSAAFW